MNLFPFINLFIRINGILIIFGHKFYSKTGILKILTILKTFNVDKLLWQYIFHQNCKFQVLDFLLQFYNFHL